MTIEISDYCNASKHMSETDRQDMETYDMAIKSLEAWDKVKEGIDEEIITSEFEDYPTYDYRLGLEKSIAIIEKYKKEIEE